MPASVDVLREQSRCKGRIEDRKEKEEIRRLLELCDQDFVPPLSHRNSTSQTNWAETEEKTDGIAEYLENICSQHVVLWKEEGVVRAFMTWKDHFNCENLEAYPDSCYLTTLCVWPDYRGQGISEVMYAEAEKDIAAKFPEAGLLPYLVHERGPGAYPGQAGI